MKELKIGLIIVAAITILVFIFIYLDKKKVMKKITEKLTIIGTVQIVKSKAFNYLLTYNGQEIQIKFLYLGNTPKLSINSPAHWQAIYVEKYRMLKTGGFENLSGNKVLIVHPTPKKITKALNESEIAFVKWEEKCFDFYLLTSKEVMKIKELF